MIERDPLFNESAADRMRIARQLRYLATSEHSVLEARIERELDELDASVIGSTPEELRELREQIQHASGAAQPAALKDE
jgi:hypothetical protein